MHSIFNLVSSILLATGAIAQGYNYGGSYGDGASGSDSSSGGGAVSGAASTPTSSAAVSKTTAHIGPKETLAGGDVKVQVVKVSNKNGDLTFAPNNITAAVGSFVQFHFYPKVSDISFNPQSIAQFTHSIYRIIPWYSPHSTTLVYHSRTPANPIKRGSSLVSCPSKQMHQNYRLILSRSTTQSLFGITVRRESIVKGPWLGLSIRMSCLPSPALPVLETNPVTSDLPQINPVQSTPSPRWLRMHPKIYHHP